MKNSIDLRSNTVTLPTPAMRHAISNASVGDYVYGEDPTTRALEIRASEQLNRESTPYVPTGSMGNQIATRLAPESILVHAVGPDAIRLVTHYDINDLQIEETAKSIRRLLA